MRKTLVILHLFLAGIAFGQTQKGSVIFNLDGSLQHYSFLGNGSLVGSTNLELGYAFLDNFFLGVNYKPAYAIDIDKRSNFQIPAYGLFSRYYFLKNKNRVYVQSDFLHQFESFNGTNDKWNFGIGLNHFLSTNVAIETHLNYNFYNRTVHYVATLGTPGDPILRNKNEPEGLGLTLGVRFFLSTEKNNLIGQISPPLVERYLKKGNKTIELYGNIGFELPDFGYILNIAKSKLLNDRLRLRHHYLGWGFVAFKDGVQNISKYEIGLTPYVPVIGNLYFTPTLSAGPLFYYNSMYKSMDYGWTAAAELGVTQFIGNSKWEIGLASSSGGYVKLKDDPTITLNAYFSSELFLNENLAIKPIVHYNLRDEIEGFDQLENGRFVQVQDFRLQFGLSYYY